ncbi:MAG: dockerin type I repeat-containing protein [bacterium]
MPFLSSEAVRSSRLLLDNRQDPDEGDSFLTGPNYRIAEGVCGDVNGDGTANITDAVVIVRYLFEMAAPPENLEDADVNFDGQITITDAVQLVNYIFSNYPGPCSPLQVGTVYVVAALDTEPMNLSGYPYSQTLTLSNYSRVGSSVMMGIMNPLYRARYVDSYGGKLKLTFYLMSSESICQSDRGCNAIYTAMKQFAPEVSAYGDELAWHLHNTAWCTLGQGYFDSSWSQIITFNGTDYGYSKDVEAAEKMLSQLLIEEGFFPTDYRAGWVWENNDFSNWLDDVMPFDFSNLAPLGSPTPPPSNVFWNYYDWSRAPRGWHTYHPSRDDYQVQGGLKRSMFYCSCCGLNGGDFENAFQRAAQGENVYLCLYGHTYTNLDNFFNMNWQGTLVQRSIEYNVPFKFATAREAACAVLGRPINTVAPALTLEQRGNSIEIRVDREIYQWLPYCAVKENGQYRRVIPQRTGDRVWTCDTTGLSQFEFAVGVCDTSGRAATAKLVRTN